LIKVIILLFQHFYSLMKDFNTLEIKFVPISVLIGTFLYFPEFALIKIGVDHVSRSFYSLVFYDSPLIILLRTT
jgi:hypothetical protein